MKEFKSHKPHPTEAKGARPAPAARKASRPISREQLEKAAEAKARKTDAEQERGGPQGPEPTRYGDWERKGICYDF